MLNPTGIVNLRPYSAFRRLELAVFRFKKKINRLNMLYKAIQSCQMRKSLLCFEKQINRDKKL